MHSEFNFLRKAMSFILNTDVKNLTLYFLQKDFSL